MILAPSDLSIALIAALRMNGIEGFGGNSAWLRQCIDAVRLTLKMNHGIESESLSAERFIHWGNAYSLLHVRNNSNLYYIELSSKDVAEHYLQSVRKDLKNAISLEACREMGYVFAFILDELGARREVKVWPS